MVCEPWVDLIQPTLYYQNKGRKPYDSLTNYVLRAHKMQILYIRITKLTKIWALSPKISPRGSCAQQALNTNIVTRP